MLGSQSKYLLLFFSSQSLNFPEQGREDDELPETMLAVVHIDSLALDNVAKPFEQHIEEDARATRNEREKHARWSRRTTHNE